MKEYSLYYSICKQKEIIWQIVNGLFFSTLRQMFRITILRTSFLSDQLNANLFHIQLHLVKRQDFSLINKVYDDSVPALLKTNFGSVLLNAILLLLQDLALFDAPQYTYVIAL